MVFVGCHGKKKRRIALRVLTINKQLRLKGKLLLLKFQQCDVYYCFNRVSIQLFPVM